MAKSISWRVIATILTLGVVYVFTYDLFASVIITAVGMVLSFILYYIHERAWEKVEWGYEVE